MRNGFAIDVSVSVKNGWAPPAYKFFFDGWLAQGFSHQRIRVAYNATNFRKHSGYFAFSATDTSNKSNDRKSGSGRHDARIAAGAGITLTLQESETLCRKDGTSRSDNAHFAERVAPVAQITHTLQESETLCRKGGTSRSDNAHFARE